MIKGSVLSFKSINITYTPLEGLIAEGISFSQCMTASTLLVPSSILNVLGILNA